MLETNTASKGSAASPAPFTANSLVAPGLTLRGVVVSKREEVKVWEGKETRWSVLGVSDGERIYTYAVKHQAGQSPVLPASLANISVRVDYCASEKGQIKVQGQWS